VVRAIQTISGEIELGKLVRAVLKVALEHGGGQRGCLMLARGGELTIEAEASLEPHNIATKILPSLPVGSSDRVPASIVESVARTRERVILDSATASGKFVADPYLARRRPRSLLCLPLLRQAEVVALLYLENSLVYGAFTANRIALLELLATQATISLQIARFVLREKAELAAAEEARQRSMFLAQTSRLLAESLDYQQVLDKFAELSVQHLADLCLIDAIEDGQVRRRAAALADPTKRPLLEEIQRCFTDINSRPASARALEMGKPLLVPEIGDAEMRTYCVNDEQLRAVRALAPRSGMVLPLFARGQILGALNLTSCTRRYGAADVELAQEFASRAAIAIDNARLYSAAREAIRVREEFLSIASHELYTPMTSLKLSLQALQSSPPRQPLSPKATAKLVSLAVSQSDRLHRLIAELLDVSRVAQNQLALKHETIDLVELVRDEVARFEPNLARAECQVSMRTVSPVIGRWDRSRLDQVVSNLLSNAVKFGAGRPIHITVDAEGARARLIVTDHGIGIDPGSQAVIFERFERAVSAQHYGGLGLGLYLCRRIVEAHAGTIRVDSRPGLGASFIVELPTI
jgi:signal transduction histidine kinase